MSTNPPGPSSDQTVNNIRQRFIPEFDAIAIRFRARMIASLTPAHRAAVGDAIGRYAIADTQDKKALTNDIDRILSATEREHVVAALSAYVAETYGLFAKMLAEVARESPESVRMNPNQQSPVSSLPGSSDAGSIVASWLPTAGLMPNWLALGPQLLLKPSSLSVIEFGRPQIRAHLRESMFGALTPVHREAAGRVLGQSAVSSTRDDAILSKQLDDVLTAPEKQHILESFATFVSEQHEAGLVFPAAARGGLPTPNAGAVLWQALLLEQAGPMGFVTQ